MFNQNSKTALIERQAGVNYFGCSTRHDYLLARVILHLYFIHGLCLINISQLPCTLRHVNAHHMSLKFYFSVLVDLGLALDLQDARQLLVAISTTPLQYVHVSPSIRNLVFLTLVVITFRTLYLNSAHLVYKSSLVRPHEGHNRQHGLTLLPKQVYYVELADKQSLQNAELFPLLCRTRKAAAQLVLQKMTEGNITAAILLSVDLRLLQQLNFHGKCGDWGNQNTAYYFKAV